MGNKNKDSNSEEKRKKEFLRIFLAAKKKYGPSSKRLAGDAWGKDWHLLFAVMLSAQTKDETTIPVAESLFKKYSSLEKIRNAPEEDVFQIIRKVNYNRTKAKNIRAAAGVLIDDFKGKVPNNLESLILIPGVGRKTANLVLGELFKKDAVCVDTHVHRISNVLDFVSTRTPEETEKELMKIAPRKYWREINRIFVLWGKETPGREREKLLSKIGLK